METQNPTDPAPSTPIPNTPPSMSAVLYKATVTRRWVASVIDSLIYFPIAILVSIISTLLFHKSFYPISPLIFIAYEVYFIWKYGATFGKKMMKIKVVNTNYQPVSFKQALIRESIGKFLSGIFSLGYFWALWDKDRQTWHDKLAKTYVVTFIPNNGKNNWLVIVLAVLAALIPLIAILAAIVVLAINPVNLVNKGRDAARLSDLAQLETAIKVALTSNIPLCNNLPPCEGTKSNDPSIRKVDGTGWVKIDLTSAIQNTSLVTLPIDPKNDSVFYYKFCSDGKNWEIEANLESTEQKTRAINDQGDKSSRYERGTDLTLCK
jgi:uncharacterized RDD family membrane protein YckC